METHAEALSRRQFLIQLGAVSATITVAGGVVSALLNSSGGQTTAVIPQQNTLPGVEATTEAVTLLGQPVPNANDPVKPAVGTRVELTPVEEHYRIDIAAIPPSIDGTSWKLPIGGLVDNPVELTLDQIKNDFPPVNQYITQECISNPVAGDLISTQYWTGATFSDVLALAKPKSEATHVRIMGADGFDETVALDLINSDPQITLNYHWSGLPLPERNGFPLRIHIPNRYGMKQPKWIVSMELVSGDQDGYWVRRGWSKDAFIRSTSVIDTVADAVTVNDQQVVPVGGIAFAGPRGISKVEVQVDGGDWNEALLRAPLNNDLEHYKTWRIWRYDWPFAAGEHTFTVRMYEADGTPQIQEPSDVHPDGATGYDSLRATI